LIKTLCPEIKTEKEVMKTKGMLPAKIKAIFLDFVVSMVYTESHSFKFSSESALAKIELKNKPVPGVPPLWDCDNFIRSVKASKNRSLFKTSVF
jgi:hypothetical protein